MQLKIWRKKAGLTQEELARQLGVTHVSVSRWENKKRRRLPEKVMNKLFEITNGEVTPNDFWEYEPNS